MSGTGAKEVKAPIRKGGGEKKMNVEFIGFVVGAVFAAIFFLGIITIVILMLFGVKIGRHTNRRFKDSAKNADARLEDTTASLMINL